MHLEIIDHYFNLLFVEIQLKKENLKSVFWGARVWVAKPVYRSPKLPGNVTVLIILTLTINPENKKNLRLAVNRSRSIC